MQKQNKINTLQKQYQINAKTSGFASERLFCFVFEKKKATKTPVAFFAKYTVLDKCKQFK